METRSLINAVCKFVCIPIYMLCLIVNVSIAEQISALSLVQNDVDSSQTIQKDKSASSRNDTQEYDLQKQVVTASGYAQDIKDAPATITIISKEEIMTRPVRDLGDILQDLPGVHIDKDHSGQSMISMRGMGSAYTLILIDGKKQNANEGFVSTRANPAAPQMTGNMTGLILPPLSMIERIEIIRGPASVVYGSDAMGGVINIITKKMDNEFHSGFQVEADFFEPDSEWGNMYGANVYVSTPIKKDKLFFNARASTKYNNQSAFMLPGKATSPNSTDGTYYARGSTTASYNHNAGFRLGYVATSENYVFLDAEVYNGRNGLLNSVATLSTRVMDTLKINSSINHEGKYNWGNLSSYIQYAYNTYAEHENVSIGANSGTPNWNDANINQRVIYQTTYNNDFNFDNFGALIVNGGIYYLYDTLLYRSVINGGGTLANAKNTHMNQFAIFGEGQYLINQYFTTTLGLRLNLSDSYSPILNPRFFLNYNPTNWLTFKAGISSGMFAPTLLQKSSDICITLDAYSYCGNENLEPEKSWNYELSAIIDTKHLEFMLTGYYTNFNNQITIGTDSSSNYQYTNIGRSLATGAELGFKLKPIYGFTLDANYAFTYTEVIDPYSGAFRSTTMEKGDPVTNIPRHSVMIKPGFTYGNFDFYLRWSGKFQTPINKLTQTPQQFEWVGNVIGSKYFKDYNILDFAATYKFKKFYALTLAINNILDEETIDYHQFSFGQNNAYTNYVNAYQRIIPSRNYWVTFKADF